MKRIEWSQEKSQWLKEVRGCSFDDIFAGWFICIERNPSRLHQKLMLFDVSGYVWAVPYVEDEDKMFAKTAFPSRRHTKIYLREDAV